MTDPKNELIFERIYESKIADYKSYFFNQVYNGIPVYGYSVTVVARTNGEILSLDSNYINISDIRTTPDLENGKTLIVSATDTNNTMNIQLIMPDILPEADLLQ